MSYKALYRTYRPQTFEDVAGQSHATITLKKIELPMPIYLQDLVEQEKQRLPKSLQKRLTVRGKIHHAMNVLTVKKLL